MEDLLKRITFNPKQCGGRPCIRGMHIRVTDVLDLLAAGLMPMEIVEELPALEIEDVTASILYALENSITLYLRHDSLAGCSFTP